MQLLFGPEKKSRYDLVLHGRHQADVALGVLCETKQQDETFERAAFPLALCIGAVRGAQRQSPISCQFFLKARRQVLGAARAAGIVFLRV